jgi:hypothetical protein
MRTGLVVTCAVLAIGCGDDGNNNSSTDAPNVPAVVTISGMVIARSTSSEPLADARIEAYYTSNDAAPFAMTTSNAAGEYAIELPTNGQPIAGYLKATAATYLDTYLYPSGAVVADLVGAPINMLTANTLNLLANTLCAANQTTTNGVIAAFVADDSLTAVAGATLAVAPAATKICYNDGGFPNRNATATDSDGVGYLFNVTGQASVSAMKAGQTFKSVTLNARGGTFTTALIQP